MATLGVRSLWAKEAWSEVASSRPIPAVQVVITIVQKQTAVGRSRKEDDAAGLRYDI